MMQFGEIVIILLLALVLLGPKRLPEVARKMGRWTAEFRKAAKELSAGIENEIADAMAPLDEVRRELTDAISEVDPKRYEWTGPKPTRGPTPEEALSDLEKIEELTEDDGVSQDRPQSILDHLEELRWRILKMGLAVVAGGIIAAFFVDQVRTLLESPFHDAAPDSSLQAIAVIEQWSILMRIVLFGGVVIASPVVLYQLWAYINPALTSKERKWAIPIVTSLVVLFLGGVAFGYYVLPVALEVLLGILPDVDNNLRVGEYYSFVLRWLFALGVTFLYPVFLLVAAGAGLVSSRQLAQGRRWAVLIMVIAAALITPTGDPINLFIIAAPLYLMYEVVYWLVRLVLKK